jgi:hypothetical protein
MREFEFKMHAHAGYRYAIHYCLGHSICIVVYALCMMRIMYALCTYIVESQYVFYIIFAMYTYCTYIIY